MKNFKRNILFALKILKVNIFAGDVVYNMFIKGRRTLDVGSGEGKLLKKERDLISGIDINDEMVKESKNAGLDVKKAGVTDIPYPDNTFEVIHCSNVIEHLFPNEARAMISEFSRLLKPGGKALIITPMPRTVWNTFGHTRPYPPMSIEKLFREVSLESFQPVRGLRVGEVFYFGTWSMNKLTFIISTTLAFFFNYFRGSYLMVIYKD
jgi:ubiquinone/menaquinone biosynthesis C-methylase UbiE